MLPEPSSFISTNSSNSTAPFIERGLTIDEVVHKYPSTRPVFERWGLNPTQQKALQHESISATCLVHHIDCDELLAELGAAL
jgi:hypothetical protein